VSKKTKVIIVMGSKSDLSVMSKATEIFKKWNIAHETQIVSAHRTPKLLMSSVVQWEAKGVKIIIAGAGGAAHLPGMLASFSILPVIGVPVKSVAMNGLDALLSIAQMPRGVPVATVAVDNATNAALLAIQMLGIGDDGESAKLRKKMKQYKQSIAKQVLSDKKSLGRLGVQQFLRKNK
jgi:phosphoribosylaminoimidazole carboxylase PurE protein